MDDQMTAQPDASDKPDYERRASASTQVIYPAISPNMEKPSNPEAPSYLLAASDMVVRFAKGHLSYEEYRETLDAWWEKNKEAWQEHDLSRLFRLICLTN
jgi:hypothetical protein